MAHGHFGYSLEKGILGERLYRAQKLRADWHTTPVLATCGIRPPEKAYENLHCHLLPLVDSEEEEYNLSHSFTHLRKGVRYIVFGILILFKQLTSLCLQLLDHRFVAWTKPNTTSLPA